MSMLNAGVDSAIAIAERRNKNLVLLSTREEVAQ